MSLYFFHASATQIESLVTTVRTLMLKLLRKNHQTMLKLHCNISNCAPLETVQLFERRTAALIASQCEPDGAPCCVLHYQEQPFPINLRGHCAAMLPPRLRPWAQVRPAAEPPSTQVLVLRRLPPQMSSSSHKYLTMTSLTFMLRTV